HSLRGAGIAKKLMRRSSNESRSSRSGAALQGSSSTCTTEKAASDSRREGQLLVKVAINGLGRIGRATLKIVMNTPGLDLVAANDLGAADNLVYLLKYDTVYGRHEKTVEATDDDHL